jgi:hypothetical protein
MVMIVPPARAVWLDLGSRTERLLEPGEHELEATADSSGSTSSFPRPRPSRRWPRRG